MPRLTCMRMFNYDERGSPMNDVTTVGIDLAKNVFSVHGVDAEGASWCCVAASAVGKLLGAHCAVATVPDRGGSVLRRARVGTALLAVRAPGASDGIEVRGTVSQERQERR